MQDTLLFQIQARNISTDEIISKLGLGDNLQPTANGCIWHHEVTAPPGRNNFVKLVTEVLEKFSDQKEFLLSLRESGSDLTFLWFPVPRDGFYTLGVTHKLMKELVSYGIALNCPYFEHRSSEVNVNPA
jgi:hypothetical protein